MKVPKIIKKLPGYKRLRHFLLYLLHYKYPKDNDIKYEYICQLHTGYYENPDKTFYIIRLTPLYPMLLFSYYYYVLGHIIYAVEHNYIPVVDAKNYRTWFNEEKPVNGTINAWEYFFEQPTEYSLEEAYASKNKILSSEQNFIYLRSLSSLNNKKIQMRNFYIAKYIKFKPSVLTHVKEQYDAIFNNKKNILGVMYRKPYRDINGLPVKDHLILPEINEYLEKTRELMHDWNMDYIFLSSNDLNHITLFKKHFANQLLISNRSRLNDCDYLFDPLSRPYLSSFEYLTDIILLSQCDALIGSISNGCIGALDFNNNTYKYKFIFTGEIYQSENKADSVIFGPEVIKIPFKTTAIFEKLNRTT
jgi:hypothetical protein